MRTQEIFLRKGAEWKAAEQQIEKESSKEHEADFDKDLKKMESNTSLSILWEGSSPLHDRSVLVYLNQNYLHV